MTQPLWKLSATEMVAAFRHRSLTPIEMLDAVHDRLQAVNPIINAVIARDPDGARAAARASAARWGRGEPLSPLDGVPFTVKDNIPVTGLPTCWGNADFAAIAPRQDELPIARLRAGGAVLIGKTNVPELTSQGYTDNRVFGPTRNPWNIALTPGGSSGGAVAAVAAGIGPFAVGTDGGGSIRRPASHAGVCGLKPTVGRVARCDGLPAILLDYEVIGPIARRPADLAAVMAVIARPDPRDPASLTLAPFAVPPPRPLRILHVPRFGAHPVDPEIIASTMAVAQALTEAGHQVETGDAPFDPDAVARIQGTVGQAGLAWLAQEFGITPVAEALAQAARSGAGMSAATLFGALDDATALRRRLSVFFADHDLMLTPAAAALPWPAQNTHPPEIAGHPVGPRGHAVFTAFANIAGLPGITIPGPRSVTGLPIGAQLVGPPGADGLLLGVAERMEAVFNDHLAWPDLP